MFKEHKISNKKYMLPYRLINFFQNFTLKQKIAICSLLLLAIASSVGGVFYYRWLHKNENVGLTREQIKSAKNQQIGLIEREYKEKERSATENLLMKKIACAGSEKYSIMGEAENKRKEITDNIRKDGSLSVEEQGKKIEKEIAVVNKAADNKIKTLEKKCNKEYQAELKKVLSVLKKE
ncbi:MAG: hypothetical protein Q7J30_00150, partial [Candidatus Azambacteria bacterium]|nr:hypothetical protein [Candidatus Azambacteria bacterium]